MFLFMLGSLLAAVLLICCCFVAVFIHPEELKAGGLGAPFCVDIVSSGCRVGVLRGYLTMTSLESLATQVCVCACVCVHVCGNVDFYCRTRNCDWLSGCSKGSGRS